MLQFCWLHYRTQLWTSTCCELSEQCASAGKKCCEIWPGKWCKIWPGERCKIWPGKWCKVWLKNCCKDWPKVVAKVGQEIVAKFGPKSCKNRLKNAAKFGRKNGCKIWPRKVRAGKCFQASAGKIVQNKQMRSISAMNSQSSINWVTIFTGKCY